MVALSADLFVPDAKRLTGLKQQILLKIMSTHYQTSYRPSSTKCFKLNDKTIQSGFIKAYVSDDNEKNAMQPVVTPDPFSTR
jgi:hypothetical protein